MKMKYVLLAFVLFSVGCASLDKTMTGSASMPDTAARQDLVKKFPELTTDQKQKFIQGKVWIGMTQAQLDAHMGGEPSKTQRKVASSGEQEIHLYSARIGTWKTGIVTKYFRAIMTDGKLSEFQEINDDVGSFDKL